MRKFFVLLFMFIFVCSVNATELRKKIIIGTEYDSNYSGIDSSTEAFTTIEYEHHEIHSGNSYGCIDVADLAINNVLDIQMVTADSTKWAHMTFRFDTESETEWHFYENVNVITPGTLQPVFNHNRNSSNASSVTVRTITNTSVANANADTAVASSQTLMAGISGAGKSEGEDSHITEIILKQNTAYSLRFDASVAGYVDYHLNWYEHQNVN